MDPNPQMPPMAPMNAAAAQPHNTSNEELIEAIIEEI